MKKCILILGVVITIILSILWYYEIMSEPIVTIASGVVTLLSYIFLPDKKQQNKSKKIILTHNGKGDNVAGNKTVKK